MYKRTIKTKMVFLLAMVISALAAKAQFTFTHVGGGLLGGTFTTNAEPGSFTMIAGGEDIWSASDSFDFAYKEITGDFDVRVKMESVETTGQWTKAGIMARESLNGDSRMAFSKVTPSGPVAAGASCGPNGQGDISFMYRTWLPDAGNGGEHEDRIVPGDGNYPTYKWIRLVRRGSAFSAYASLNGYQWVGPQTQDSAAWLSPIGGAGTPTPMTNTLLVGLGVSRHGCSPAEEFATVEFRNVDTRADVHATSVTVPQGHSATFGAILTGLANWTGMQWMENGVDLADATNEAYMTAPTAVADSGKKYSFRVTDSLSGQTFTSAEATLTVTPDNTAPTLVSASAPGTFAHFFVVFSEEMMEQLVEDGVNYTVSDAANNLLIVDGAEVQADRVTVKVLLNAATPLLPATTYTVTIASEVTDLAGNPLEGEPKTFETWVQSCAPFVFEAFPTGGGTAISALTGHASYPNFPDDVRLMNVFDTRAALSTDNYRDNYGGRLRGLFVPQQSGNYVFYLHSDDASELYLNPNGMSAAGKQKIAEETSCCRDWPTIASAPIHLEAWHAYYIEGLWKEGGGGDYIRVAARLEGSSAALQAIAEANVVPQGIAGRVQFTQQPTNLTVLDNAQATFAAAISNPDNIYTCYQWQSSPDGATWTDIAGATSPTYSFNATLADSGTQYRVVAGFLGDKAASEAVTLTVNTDVEPPMVAAVGMPGSYSLIEVVFSERVVQALVEDGVVYTITDPESNPLVVDSAVLQPDGKTVRLTLNESTPLLPATVYTVAVSADVTDLAGNNLEGDPVTFESWVQSTLPFVFEAYPTGGGTTVDLLINHASYPNNPDDVRAMTVFDTRAALGTDNYRENYGGRLRGIFMVPATGNYIFYLHSDDSSELYVNPTGIDPAGKQRIAQETGCCNDWPVIASIPVYLEAFKPYYIEGLWKEGGGGDYIRVAARLQGSSDALVAIAAPSAAPRGLVGELTFTQQPANVTVFENTIATFSVATANPNNLTPSYQWQASTDGGATWTNIPSATSASYSARVAAADNGTQFRAEAGILGDVKNSAAATVTVETDSTAPIALSAKADQDPGIVYVKFSELVAPGTATDAVNYVIDDGAGGSYVVDSATLLPDGMTVRLSISPGLPENITASVSVENVTDIAASPNGMDATTLDFRTFKFMPGFLTFEAYDTGGGTSVDLLTNYVDYPDSPRERLYMNRFDTRTVYPDDTHDNYGARIRGVFIPNQTGNWIFYISSDDASALFMNTNLTDSANPDGAVLIAQEVGCCASYMAQPDPKTSPTIYLEAGQKYYIEGLVKEGGGGDYMRVAARMEGQPVPPNTEFIMSNMIGTYADPTGDPLVAITAQPTDLQACYVVGQAAPTAQFCVTAAGTRAGAEERVYYQWQKDTGTGFVDVFNALGNCYSYIPPLSDNGAKYRVMVTVPGGEPVISEAVTLTVLQANTPPLFTKGANLTITEGAGPQTVAGWATGIQAHSISRNPVVYAADFSPQQAASPTIQVLNPVAYWRLNEASGTVAANLGANGANGTYHNVVLGVAGPRATAQAGFEAGNTAAQFNDTSAYVSSGSSFLSGVGAFTMAAWIRPTATQNDRTGLFGQNDAVEFGFINATTIQIWTPGGGQLDLAYPYAVNEWHHVAVVGNGTDLRIYLDGALAGTGGAATTSYGSSTYPFNIGGGGIFDTLESNGNWFNGQIDEVAVWTSALTAAQIQQMYQAATTPTSTPAGAEMWGQENAVAGSRNNLIEDGALKLTKAVNDASGVFYTPAVSQPIESYSVSFKTIIGGASTCCNTWPNPTSMADGMSINVANDLPYPGGYNSPGEEGAGTGLIVAFDTWDNGGGEAPAFELKWKGTSLGTVKPPEHIAQPPDGNPRWIDVNLTVDADGLATLSYDGTNVFENVPLPGYQTTAGLRVGLGARTGGANANHWVDDLRIEAFPPDATGAERNQTVQFVVTNDSPALFTAQPAISPEGTLTFTPAAGVSGQATVTVVAQDNGGLGCNGNDTSAAQTFVINVVGPTLSFNTVAATGGGSNLEIKWPAGAAGYKLQTTTSLAPGSVWVDVTEGISVVNGQNVLAAPMTGSNRFYRLVLMP